MDAVPEAIVTLKPQLSKGHRKNIKKRDGKFETSFIPQLGMHESIQLKRNGFAWDMFWSDGFVDDFSMFEASLGSVEASKRSESWAFQRAGSIQ